MILRRTDFRGHNVAIEPELTDAKEEVCVDLHVGDSFMEAGSSSSYPLEKPYLLHQGACIIVRTSELISLPNDVFGTLCAKGSLAALGFLVPNTKIDPLFSDRLDVALFNAGTRTLRVEKGMAFCSAIFHQLPGPIAGTTPRPGIRVIEVKQQRARTVLRAINKHVENWRGVYALVAALLAILYGLLKALGKIP
jgi:deoxycytidine triphosphate deaminase